VPVEVPGVVGVTATGNLQMKSFYSSFGAATTDVAAPGGDSILQVTAAAPNGRVLSTWPASLLATGCARPVIDASGATYCYAQGTSMASPHAVGVAALLESATGKRGAALSAALQQATNPLSCPSDTSAYDFFPAVDGGALQTCQGGTGHNSWFGSGEVDALKAVE
jgi:subtilisin family serine protease